MAGNVDERIVRMQFDNTRFEKNVQQSLSTIDKLKKALKLDKAAEGFDAIDKAANHISFKGLNDSLAQVHANFSLLDVTVFKIFDRIADGAINLGKKIVNALAVEPITTGFQEYETKMNSIQVIAANTGALNQDAAESAKSMADSLAESIEAAQKIWLGPNVFGNGQDRIEALAAAGLDPSQVQSLVNKMASGVEVTMDDLSDEVETSSGTTVEHIEEVLDNLNLYADKTIYNFTQMTQAIGQFTTAGIDVDTSARSVKGIANLAAYVGAPASDASRSMFQLSQALATGRVRLQDWMSLEHTAGMGGKTFQDALKATAEHLMEVDDSYRAVIEDAGYGSIEELVMDQGSFRESLAQNWLTTDVLSETLAKFAGDFDEAYWKDLGYSDEAVKEIMDLGTVATDAATKVRTFTQMWDALKEAAQSGWTETWQYIVGGFTDAPKLWTAINNAITGIIDPFNDARNEALKFWYNLSGEIGGRKAWFDAIEETTIALDENGEKIAKVGEDGEALKDSYGNIVYETEKVTKYTGILKNIWDGLAEIIAPIKEALQEVFPVNLGKVLVDLTLRMRSVSEQFRDSDKHATSLKAIFTTLFKVVKVGLTVFKGFAKVGKAVVKAVINITDNLLTTTDAMVGTADEGDKLGVIMDTISGIFDRAAGFIENLSEKFTGSERAINIVKGLWDGLVGGFRIGLAIFEAVGKVIGHLIESLLPAGDAFGDAAEGVLDFVKNVTDIDSIISWIDGAADSVISFIDNFGDNFQKVVDLVATWIKDTTGVDIYQVWDWLTGQMDTIKSTLTDMDRISFDNIKAMFTSLRESSPMIETLSSFVNNLKKGADTVNSIPDELTEAKKEVKGIKTEVNGIKSFGLTSIFSGVGDSFTKALENLDVGDLAGATSAVALALTTIEGLKIVSDFGKITKSIVDLKTGVLDMLSAIGDSFSTVKNFLKSQMILNIAVALGILALALLALSAVPEENISRALGAMITLFWGLNAVLNSLTKTLAVSGARVMGFTLIAIGAALLMISGAIAILGSMGSDKLGSGLAAIYTITGALKLLFKGLENVPIQNLDNIGTNVIKIALAMGILLYAVSKLSDSGKSLADFGPALLVVTAIGTIISGLIFMLSKFNPKELSKIGTTMILIAVSIDMIVGALAGLTAVAMMSDTAGGNSFWKAFIGVMSIMGGVIVLIGVMEGLAKNTKESKIAAIGGIMMGIAFAINMIVGALAGLALIISNDKTGDALPGAMFTLIMIGAIIGIYIDMISKIKGSSIKAGGVLTLVLGSITAMMASIVGMLAFLSSIENLDAGLKAFDHIAIVIGAIIGVMTLLQIFRDKIGGGVNLKLNLSSFAVNFAIFAAALLATAAAVWAFVDAFKNLWDLLKTIGNDGKDTLINLINTVFDKDVMLAAIMGFVDFTDVLIANLPFIMSRIGAVIGVIAASTFNLIPPILLHLCTAIADALHMLQSSDALGGVIVEAVSLIAFLLNAIGDEMINQSDALGEGLWKILVGLWDILVAMFKTVREWFETTELYEAMGEGWLMIIDFFENVGNWFVDWWDTFMLGWTTIKDWFSQFGDSFGEIALNIGIMFLKNMYWWLYRIPEWFNWIALQIWNFPEWLSGKVTEALQKLIDSIKMKADEIFQAGKDLIDGFINGLLNRDSNAKLTAATQGGLVDIVKKIITGKDGFDSHSPSVWAHDQGAYVVDGFTNGITDQTPEALAGFQAMVDQIKATDTTLPAPTIDTSTMTNYADALAEYDGENPTIEYDAVVNWDDVFNSAPSGLGLDLDSVAAKGAGLSLDTTTSFADMSAFGFDSMMNQEQPEPYDDTDVISAIEELGNKFDDLTRHMNDIDIRLDTGVLVGEMVGPMDAALGRRATRIKRGG